MTLACVKLCVKLHFIDSCIISIISVNTSNIWYKNARHMDRTDTANKVLCNSALSKDYVPPSQQLHHSSWYHASAEIRMMLILTTQQTTQVSSRSCMVAFVDIFTTHGASLSYIRSRNVINISGILRLGLQCCCFSFLELCRIIRVCLWYSS